MVSTAAGSFTGLAEVAQVLFPIGDVWSSPQQYARPAVVTAHVWIQPVAIRATFVLVSPVVVSTATGVVRGVAVWTPSPIWAAPSEPQQ